MTLDVVLTVTFLVRAADRHSRTVLALFGRMLGHDHRTTTLDLLDDGRGGTTPSLKSETDPVILK